MLAAPACGWSCGYGLFKTLLCLAILDRYIPGGHLPGALSILGSDTWFIPICVAGGFEMIIDLIPRIDLRWHRLTAHISIIGAGVLAWFLMDGQDGMTRVMALITAAILAAVAWCVHTAPRRASIPAGTSNFISPIASLTEDCIIGSLLLPLSAMPPLTILMLIFTIVAGVLIMYIIWPSVRQEMNFLFTLKPAPPHQEPMEHHD